ncbi:hypothetical protein [Cronobacter dublinensis]|nr:hypothetical protein [Cronobacter dublinensis]
MAALAICRTATAKPTADFRLQRAGDAKAARSHIVKVLLSRYS